MHLKSLSNLVEGTLHKSTLEMPHRKLQQKPLSSRTVQLTDWAGKVSHHIRQKCSVTSTNNLHAKDYFEDLLCNFLENKFKFNFKFCRILGW